MPALMPVDISGMDGNENIDYNEDAIELLKNSTIFDQFITDTMNDFEQFSKKKLRLTQKLIDYLQISLHGGGIYVEQYFLICEQMG